MVAPDMEQQDEARIARLLTEHLRWGSLMRWRPPILDNYWSARLDPELIGAKLAGFYQFRWQLAVCIAGKRATPDAASFALAARVLPELPTHLLSIRDDLNEWTLSQVAFPYQKGRPLWYVLFLSEYDGDLEYAFRGSSDDGFNPSPVSGYESVPDTINVTLDDLRDRCTAPDQGLAEVTERIEREKLFGTELIRPVMEILERQVAQSNRGSLSWRKKKLQEIAEHAE